MATQAEEPRGAWRKEKRCGVHQHCSYHGRQNMRCINLGMKFCVYWEVRGRTSGDRLSVRIWYWVRSGPPGFVWSSRLLWSPVCSSLVLPSALVWSSRLLWSGPPVCSGLVLLSALVWWSCLLWSGPPVCSGPPGLSGPPVYSGFKTNRRASR